MVVVVVGRGQAGQHRLAEDGDHLLGGRLGCLSVPAHGRREVGGMTLVEKVRRVPVEHLLVVGSRL